MKNLLAIGMVVALSGTALGQVATMPAQTSTFNGSTRGYYFVAPVSFKITGVHALNQTGSANGFQNFAIVKFDGNTPPPLFPSVTNAFQQLALGLDLPSGMFHPVNVTVNAGDVIGIYGNTTAGAGGTTGSNSYANAPGGNNTSVFGNTIPLMRSGMQFHLGSATSPAGMHDVWAEGASNTSNISRVEFEYTQIPAPGALALLGLGGLAAARRRR